jgi:potassium-dependent mechanosensitive channel
MANRCASMALILRRFVLAAAAVIGLAVGCGAFAQTPVASHAAQKPATQGSHASTGDVASNADKPSPPAINTGAIVKQLNQELGLNLTRTTGSWGHELSDLEAVLQHKGLRYSELNAYRDELQQLRSQVEDLSGRLAPRLEAAQAQIKMLGPAPAAGQLVPDEIARGRAELDYRLGLLSAGDAAINSAKLRIGHLLDRIEDVRRNNFTSYLLRPIPGIYAYQTWSELPQDVPRAAEQLRDLITGWWDTVQDRKDVGRIALEAASLFLLLCFAGWRGVRGLRRRQDADEPPFWLRASSAAGVVLLRALPVAIPVVFAYGMIAADQQLPDRIDWLFYLTAQAAVIVSTVAALATTAFAPRAPQWRLIAVSDAAAARICALVTLLALVYSVTTLLYAITRLVQAPFALTIAVALPSGLLLAALVVAILRTPTGAENPAAPSMRFLRAIRWLAWIIVAAIVACALTGYLPLARFLAQQLVVTGSILGLVYLLLLWVDGFAQSVSDDGAAAGRWLKARANLDRARREQLVLPVGLLLKLAVVVLSVPLIMLQWGYSWPDIEEWYRQLFFGFHFGSTQVTFGALLAAVIVFALGYGAARLFQGWLDAQVLQRAGISGGVRHSIRTGVGYAGICVAALAAFSYAGFNLSSLAIVAGAFSIGIGFGLQNLVNNFVSGLIMLAERPIRVGDLVAVGGEEGYVRKISVRSTEIETFERANVLIPNSSFISDKVKNWTLRNSVRRLAIPIGTTYACDPRHVRDTLLKVASDNPDVLRAPAPIVDLKEFGAASLNFVLYAYIDDMSQMVRVRTELSIAILDAFADAGIGIPVTPTEVRNIDRLHDARADAPSLHDDTSLPQEQSPAIGRGRFPALPAAAD